MARLSPEEGFEVLQDRVKKTVDGLFPVIGKKHTLELDGVEIKDNLHIDDIRSQKKAKIGGRTWAVPVEAKVTLKDNATGKKVDSQTVRLMNLPKTTRRFSHIVSGQEYQIDNQWRLKRGVFARVKANGELASEFNVDKGRNFALQFDPQSRAFTMKYGDSNIPLQPLIEEMGVPKEAVEQRWGKQIASAQNTKTELALKKFYKASTGDQAPDLDTARTHLKDTFSKTGLNPEVTKVTLGKDHNTVSGAALLDASDKLLKISQGKTDPDNRDALRFKELHSTEDFFSERLERGSRDIMRKLQNNIDRKKKVREIVGPDVFNRPIRMMYRGTLANVPDQTNPLEMVSGQMKTTITGEGGIQGMHGISEEAKLVDPSHLGFLDPIHTPEGKSTGISLRMPIGVKKTGNEVKITAYDVKKGKNVQLTPAQVADANIALPDQVRWKNGKPVAAGKKVKMSGVGNEIIEAPMSKADYVMRDPVQMFSMASNMIPFIAADHPNRSTMAGRHMEQAISLKDRDEPLVQSLAGTKSFEDIMGQFAGHASHVDGKVVRVKKDGILIKDAKGKNHEVQLYDNFPLNADKSFIHSASRVKAGDAVKKGQIVADTNFTKNGKLALGKNLQIGYMPYKGYNFEDGVVISETAAKKLSSEHLHRKEVMADQTTLLDKKKFKVYVPESLTREQDDKLEDDGIIKPGTIVNPGDTLIAALRKREVRPEDKELSKLHKSLVKPYIDSSVKWESDLPGVVEQVVKKGGKVGVHVKTLEPMVIGDKLAGRHGNKGIVTKILPDDEMPQTASGRPLEVLMNPTGVPGRTNLGQMLEVAAGKVAEKTGKPYSIKNFQPSADLHAQIVGELKRHGFDPSGKEDIIDPKTGKKIGRALTGPQHIIKLKHQVDKKIRARAGGPGYAYDRNMVPKSGGPHGAQALGALGLYSMLAHGAKHNLREMQTLKCFTWGTPVITDQGAIQIGKIVNQKLDVEVLSYDFVSGDYQFKSITNHWKRELEADDQLLELTYYARGSDGVFRKHSFLCTDNHLIYDQSGTKVPAQDMRGRSVAVPALTPSKVQYDVLVGSLLGDGSLQIHNGPYPAFQERHAVSQKEYLTFKAAILSDFSRREVREYNAGEEGFNCGQMMCEWATLAQPAFAPLHDMFYRDGERCVPDDIASHLTPLSVAVWYQDDGSLVHGERQRILRLHTGKLPEADRERLIEALHDLIGVRFTHSETRYEYKGMEGAQWSLRLGACDEIDRFLEFVRPYVHSSMSYKVGGQCGQALADISKQASASEALLPSKVLSVIKRSPRKWDGKYLYDLEVDGNHNYFANHALVSNSDAAQSDDFWTALQSGEPLPAPRATFAYKKFQGLMKGLGLNIKKEGNNLQLIPFTDKQVTAMSNGEIKDPARMVRAKDLKPEKAGIFDEHKTGGIAGDKWSHMTLPEPYPNPLFENAVQAVTGLDSKSFNSLVHGKKALDPKTGQLHDDLDNGLVGGKALSHILKKVDTKTALRDAVKELQNPALKGTRLDKANKKVKYLKALDKAGITPHDAYMVTKVPILPPNMRPLSQMQNGDLNIDDLNHMYKGISLSASRLKSMSPLLPEEEKAEIRGDVYDGLKALAGLGGHLNREFRGISDVLSGKRPELMGGRGTGRKVGSPKEGFFQSKLVQRKQDLSMRSTIIPEPALGLDEVGLPRKAAMELYKPFVIREIRGLTGASPLDAQKMMKEGGEQVNRALDRVIADRPVLLKRDPVLHKYGIQAFNPRIVGGKAVQIHPLVTSGFNADFDGDTMAAFVPIKREAVDEAKKMVPSRNLFSPSTGDVMYAPTLETQLGLYGASKPGSGKPKEAFKTVGEMETAVRAGKVGMNDTVRVGGLTNTSGRFMVAGALPEKMRKDFLKSQTPLDKKGQKQLLTQIAKEHKNDYGTAVNKLKDLGNEWVTQNAFSVGLDDITPDKAIRDRVLAAADKEVAGKSDAAKVSAYSKATTEMHKILDRKAESADNLTVMNRSGIKPYTDTLRQIKMAPMLINDASGRTIPRPVRKSYAEGLDLADYWTSMSGARKGIIEKVQTVQEPGYVSKQVMNSVMDNIIVDDDCGADRGIALSVDEKDVMDRFLAVDHKAGKKVFKAGTLVTPEVRNSLKNNKVNLVNVRSPLRCQHGPGICKKCYGLTEDGSLPDKGLNVGVLAGQSLGERATQLSMKAFHTGGTASSATEIVDEFGRVKNLLRFPKTLRGSATLAQANGKVENVQRDPAGGHNVFVGGQRHYIPSTRGAPVYNGRVLKKGMQVRKGMPISRGPVNPHEMLPLTGVEPVQGYLSSELHNIYGSHGIRRRNSEVVVKALTNLTRVEDPGSHGGFLRGDFVPQTTVANLNRKAPKGTKPIRHRPVLKGVDILPLEMQEDWMARMNHERIQQTVVDAAQQGWTSSTHGKHPIPAVVYGVEIGKGKPGEY